MSKGVGAREFHESDGVEDWRAVGDGASAFFRTGSLAAGARFVERICRLPGVDERVRPDIDLRHEGVTVRLSTLTGTRAYDGHTEEEIELARRISLLARELEIAADPSALRTLQVAVDALTIPEVLPFWQAALGYVRREDTDEDLIDPLGRGPSFWFQQLDAPRPQRNRIHLDIAVPHDQADARVAAVLANGGRRVDEDRPWVLADPEGNEVCLGSTGW